MSHVKEKFRPQSTSCCGAGGCRCCCCVLPSSCTPMALAHAYASLEPLATSQSSTSSSAGTSAQLTSVVRLGSHASNASGATAMFVMEVARGTFLSDGRSRSSSWPTGKLRGDKRGARGGEEGGLVRALGLLVDVSRLAHGFRSQTGHDRWHLRTPHAPHSPADLDHRWAGRRRHEMRDAPVHIRHAPELRRPRSVGIHGDVA